MTALTTKQRVKLNAQLAIAHYTNNDVTAIQREVARMEAQGRSRTQAYEAVFGRLTASSPALAKVLSTVTSLIEASDSGTVGRYDAAISAYNETGDDKHLNALEPMMRQDRVALAIRNSEISSEDVAAGRFDWGALGMGKPDGERDSFQFNPGQQPAPAGPQASKTAPQPQPDFSSGGGVRSAATQSKWNKELLPTTSKASPYAGMSPAQIKDAMRADFAAPRGFIGETTAE